MKFFLAEFFGTALMVLFGTLSIVLSHQLAFVNDFVISLSFGFIVMVMIYIFRNISGAHINPAVSLGFYLLKKLSSPLLFLYVFAQLLGGTFASFLISILFPNTIAFGETVPQVGIGEALFIEIFISMILMAAILWIANHKQWSKFTPPVVGIVVCILAYIFGPYTGASMNPARSFGPAMFSNTISVLYLYFIGPCLGTTIGCLAYKMITS